MNKYKKANVLIIGIAILLNLFTIFMLEVLNVNNSNYENANIINIIGKIIICLFINILLLIYLKNNKYYVDFVYEITHNKKMLATLSKNDFKMKYAASNFGIFWAFVQPVVTIMIYVFVFQIGFKAAGTDNGYPYVLFLVAGIVPWFFFNEALMNSTNCLIEYSYLVKKVVFNINILPIVKVMSALFIHLFFVILSIGIFAVNGKMPNIYYIQILYYMICVICFVVALSYLTAAITPFFPDFSQIMIIIIQIGMWMIPIMWDEKIIAPAHRWILKLNPMYYIVNGYRDSLIYRIWFWEKPNLSLYFWGITVAIFLIGYRTFRKLKSHFADVL